MSPDENKTPAELIAEEEACRRARIAEQDKRIAEFQHEQLRRLVRLLPVFFGLAGAHRSYIGSVQHLHGAAFWKRRGDPSAS